MDITPLPGEVNVNVASDNGWENEYGDVVLVR